MNRREFFKAGGLVFAAFLLQITPAQLPAAQPIEVHFNDVVYRGAKGGVVYASHDAGRTWQVHTRFGPECEIQALFLNRAQQVTTRLGYAGHNFDLALGKGGWHTVQG